MNHIFNNSYTDTETNNELPLHRGNVHQFATWISLFICSVDLLFKNTSATDTVPLGDMFFHSKMLG